MDTEGPVYEAMSHLGAALSQSIPEDDQIIMGHVRDAHALLSAAWRAQRQADVAAYQAARASTESESHE